MTRPAARWSRRAWLGRTAGLLGAVALGTAGRPALAWTGAPAAPRRQSDDLVLYTSYQPWFDEVAPAFERETGVRVTRLGSYTADAAWWAKLQAGERIDLCVPSTEWVQRGLVQDAFSPIDLALVPNYSGILREFQHRDLYVRAGATYAVPFTLVYHALAWNPLAGVARPTSWRAAWDPQWAGRVTMPDDARLMTALGAILLDDDPNAITKWDQLRELLTGQQPLVREYWADSTAAADRFLAGDLVLGALPAAAATSANDRGGSLTWLIPPEGSLFALDCFAVPATARNVEAAHRFLDYVLRPENMALAMKLLRCDTVSEAGHRLLPEADNRRLRPPDGARLFALEGVSAETQRQLDDFWRDVRSTTPTE